MLGDSRLEAIRTRWALIPDRGVAAFNVVEAVNLVTMARVAPILVTGSSARSISRFNVAKKLSATELSLQLPFLLMPLGSLWPAGPSGSLWLRRCCRDRNRSLEFFAR